jgi:hypothetical protein
MALASLAAAAAVSCGARVPEVPRGPHPSTGGAAPFGVDSAPPPAAIEQVSESPDSDCLWQDGTWSVQNGDWVWLDGGWVRPTLDCYLAEASLVWVPAVNQHGALFFTPAQWYQSQGSAPCAPPPRCEPK